MISEGDISQEDYKDIFEHCKKYSRGLSKYGKHLHDVGPRTMNIVSRGVI